MGGLQPGVGALESNYAEEAGGNLEAVKNSSATIASNTSKDATGISFPSFKKTVAATNITVTPAAGKRLRIKKVFVTQSGNNNTFVNVMLSSTSMGTFLQGENIASSWVITLPVNEPLVISTDIDGVVYVNIQKDEI